jgi:hypothetical protein
LNRARPAFPFLTFLSLAVSKRDFMLGGNRHMSAIHNGLLIIGLALAVALPLLERLGGLRLDCADKGVVRFCVQ